MSIAGQDRSAAAQSRRWQSRARDWAEFQEGASQPVYDAVIEDARIGPGTTVLDIGCGSGVFCATAAAAGAVVSGLDVAEALIGIARTRVPTGRFTVGDMVAMPYRDGAFEVVTGFNSLHYGVLSRAIDEARRVVAPDGTVVIATWAGEGKADAAEYLRIVIGLQSEQDVRQLFRMMGRRQLEIILKFHKLRSQGVRDVPCPWRYPDRDTAMRALMSSGPAVQSSDLVGEHRVRNALDEMLDNFHDESGAYVLQNTFRYIIARPE